LFRRSGKSFDRASGCTATIISAANGARRPGSRLITPPFRVSSPHVFSKQVFEGEPESSGRYCCTALFAGFEVGAGATSLRAPSAWCEKDQAKWHAIIRACDDVAIVAFKKPMSELRRIGGYKLPFQHGEEKDFEGYEAGVVCFTMSARKRPGIIARDLTPITQYGPDEFYAGCYARASVTAFANIQWRLLAIGLHHLQKLADGPRLDGCKPATDEYGELLDLGGTEAVKR
jgi:Protein of unknown function (DUF2815)